MAETGRENNAAIDIVAELTKQYYKGNFGCMPKAEIDLLMFAYFFKDLRDKNPNNPNAYSDFTISQKLGISEGRVSNLKVRTELKYPYLEDWKEKFSALLPNVRLSGEYVKLHIPDKNMLLKIKNEIEEKGGYVDISLNGHLLQVQKQLFMTVILSIVDKSHYDAFAKGISKITRFGDFAQCSIAEVLGKDTKENVVAAAKEFLPVLLKFVPVDDSIKEFVENNIKALSSKPKAEK